MRCSFKLGLGHTCHQPAREGSQFCERHASDRPPTRRTSPPPVFPSDPARLHVAMWKIANALGVQLEAGKPDHELLEKIADGLNPKLAAVFVDAYHTGWSDGHNATLGDHEPALSCNPFDGSPLR